MKGCAGIGRNDRDADRVRLVPLNQVVGGDKGFTGLLREADDEEEVKTNTKLEGLFSQMLQHRDGQPLFPFSQMHDLFVARFHSDEQTDAAGGAHLLQQYIAETIDSRFADPFDRPTGGNNQIAEPGNPFLVEREGRIAEINLGDALPFDDLFQLGKDSLRSL